MEVINQHIDNLYNVFSEYTIQGKLRERSCYCCVIDEEIRQLLSKPLKELTKKDISHFMTSAITTFGDLEDYKHFLPRILELMINNDNVLDDFLTYEKLNYSKWQKWEAKEILPIKFYFKALLIDALEKNKESIDDCVLLNLKYNDFEMLSEILLNTNSEKFIKNIIENTLCTNAFPLDKRLTELFSDKKILDKIEVLFFEENDIIEANRISIAYSILENEKNI